MITMMMLPDKNGFNKEKAIQSHANDYIAEALNQCKVGEHVKVVIGIVKDDEI